MEADKVSTPTADMRQRGDRNRMLLPASRTGSQNFPRGGLAIEYLDKGHHTDSALSSWPRRGTEGYSSATHVAQSQCVIVLSMS